MEGEGGEGDGGGHRNLNESMWEILRYEGDHAFCSEYNSMWDCRLRQM